MKYIDADKLKKIINDLYPENCLSKEATGFYDAIDKTCDVIDFLQQEQPEVDLKKKTKEWVNLIVGATFPEEDGDFLSEEDYRSVIRQTALHFYELGKNSK